MLTIQSRVHFNYSKVCNLETSTWSLITGYEPLLTQLLPTVSDYNENDNNFCTVLANVDEVTYIKNTTKHPNIITSQVKNFWKVFETPVAIFGSDTM